MNGNPRAAAAAAIMPGAVPLMAIAVLTCALCVSDCGQRCGIDDDIRDCLIDNLATFFGVGQIGLRPIQQDQLHHPGTHSLRASQRLPQLAVFAENQ